MKREYGITTIKLILIIVLIIGIFCGGFFLLHKLWNVHNIKNLKTDLLYIQAKGKVIKDKHILNENDELMGEKIEEYPDNKEVNEIISESDKWYELDQEDLEQIGKGNLKSEDGYIINYDTEDVIYAKGIKEGDNIFYKLSDIIKQENTDEGKNDEENNQDNKEGNEEIQDDILDDNEE